jgi:thioredoxin reductase (NADPH)
MDSEEKEEIKDTIIIGAGPAGVAATVQLQRYGLDFIVFEKGPVGGLLNNANLVENYPGFPDGIPGRQLVAFLNESTDRLGDRLVRKAVESLDFDGQYFKLRTDQDSFRSRTSIIASGTKPRLWTGTQIPESVGDRVFYEIFPIIDSSDKTIAIVGAGDAAFDYALNLTRDNQGNRVTILNRGSETKCLPLLKERAAASEHIDYRNNVRIVGL